LEFSLRAVLRHRIPPAKWGRCEVQLDVTSQRGELLKIGALLKFADSAAPYMRALFKGKGCGLEERWGAREMLAWGNSDIQVGSWPIERSTRRFLTLSFAEV
jgi:hypothetical protein